MTSDADRTRLPQRLPLFCQVSRAYRHRDAGITTTDERITTTDERITTNDTGSTLMTYAFTATTTGGALFWHVPR